MFAELQPHHWGPALRYTYMKTFLYHMSCFKLWLLRESATDCYPLLSIPIYCHTHMHIVVRVPRSTLPFDLQLARKSKHREVSRRCQYAVYRFSKRTGPQCETTAIHSASRIAAVMVHAKIGNIYTSPAASAAGKQWLIRSGPVLCRLLSDCMRFRAYCQETSL